MEAYECMEHLRQQILSALHEFTNKTELEVSHLHISSNFLELDKKLEYNVDQFEINIVPRDIKEE